MNVVIKVNYLSLGRKLYRAGEVIDLDEDMAESLLARGIVTPAESRKPQTKTARKAVMAADDDIIEDAGGLPEIQPAVVKKKGKK